MQHREDRLRELQELKRSSSKPSSLCSSPSRATRRERLEGSSSRVSINDCKSITIDISNTHMHKLDQQREGELMLNNTSTEFDSQLTKIGNQMSRSQARKGILRNSGRTTNTQDGSPMPNSRNIDIHLSQGSYFLPL